MQRLFKYIFCITVTGLILTTCDWYDRIPDNNLTGNLQLDSPRLYSPASGAQTHHIPPPLLVYNVENTPDITLQYDFELYEDDGTSLIESTGNVNEHDSLFTRWVPFTILSPGREYVWRARAATRDGFKGPWMDKSSFFTFDHKQNIPDRYLAFGDSITGGFGSSTFGTEMPGYQYFLQTFLTEFYGTAEIITRWIGGGFSLDGVNTIDTALESDPTVVLILFGSHDITMTLMEKAVILGHLDTMVQKSLDHGSLPVLATIPPLNPASIFVSKQHVINSMNELIRNYCHENNVVLADVNYYLREESNWDDTVLATFFSDHEHPNDEGYLIMANAWYDAIISKNMNDRER